MQISGFGDNDKFQGYDDKNPYKVTINFSPGQTLESNQINIKTGGLKEADTWKTANKITFDRGNYGNAVIHNYGYYWDDIDWFYFSAKENGWLRITVDLRNMEDNNPDKSVISVFARLYEKSPLGMKEVDSVRISASDSPGNPVDRAETTSIIAGNDYYFRFLCFEAPQDLPYIIKIEYYPGNPEDLKPGPVGSADTPQEAYDLGLFKLGETKEISSYLFHYLDVDFYKITTPAEKGSLNIILDYTASYNEYGWCSGLGCQDNPLGIKIWLYLYDSSILEKDEEDNYGNFLDMSAKDDTPAQEINFPASPNSVYYIFITSRANWDLKNPYKLRVTYSSKLNPSSPNQYTER